MPARSAQKESEPSFRNSAARRRANIPAAGYSEWVKNEARKKIPLPD
ncbi:SOS response-associated peptidase family protein [Rhodococcus sp. 3Y1]